MPMVTEWERHVILMILMKIYPIPSLRMTKSMQEALPQERVMQGKMRDELLHDERMRAEAPERPVQVTQGE